MRMHEVLNEIPFFEGNNLDEFLDLFLTQNELTFKIKNFKVGSSPGIDISIMILLLLDD